MSVKHKLKHLYTELKPQLVGNVVPAVSTELQKMDASAADGNRSVMSILNMGFLYLYFYSKYSKRRLKNMHTVFVLDPALGAQPFTSICDRLTQRTRMVSERLRCFLMRKRSAGFQRIERIRRVKRRLFLQLIVEFRKRSGQFGKPQWQNGFDWLFPSDFATQIEQFLHGAVCA